MQKKTPKLSLNQETLKNLTEEQLRNVEGGNFSNPPRYTCPECAPPPDTFNCPPKK